MTNEPEDRPGNDIAEDEQDASATIDVDADEVDAIVEAVLFAVDSPISPQKIAQVAELPGRIPVKDAIERLNCRYDERGTAFRIEPIAGGYQMLTREEYNDVLGRLYKTRSDSRLSQAALETLAIVAYRQPIMRADVEAIRGVACGEVLRKLMEKQLVKIVGRAEVLGRPMLYGTTRQFLEAFGLNSIEDLPRVEELRQGAQRDADAGISQAGDEQQQPTVSASSEARPAAGEPAGQEEVGNESVQAETPTSCDDVGTNE